MNLFKDFFEAEKKRVLTPDAFFTRRVMARFKTGSAWEYGIWDIMPTSTRPVLALALVLILCFVAGELLIPQMPQRGMVESILDPEQSPAESFLYNEADIPARQVVLQQLISLEEQQ